MLRLLSIFLNFYCVSQEYGILYLETRRAETLETEVFEVKSPPQAPKKSVFLGQISGFFWEGGPPYLSSNFLKKNSLVLFPGFFKV